MQNEKSLLQKYRIFFVYDGDERLYTSWPEILPYQTVNNMNGKAELRLYGLSVIIGYTSSRQKCLIRLHARRT